MIQDELAKKEMEKPVNLRNVERSLLKRVVDDVMRLLVFLTPKISVKSEVYNPEAYITLFQNWFFLRTNQNLRPYIVSLTCQCYENFVSQCTLSTTCCKDK